jgi:hypothetical protein
LVLNYFLRMCHSFHPNRETTQSESFVIQSEIISGK